MGACGRGRLEISSQSTNTPRSRCLLHCVVLQVATGVHWVATSVLHLSEALPTSCDVVGASRESAINLENIGKNDSDVERCTSWLNCTYRNELSLWPSLQASYWPTLYRKPHHCVPVLETAASTAIARAWRGVRLES